jgi:hypothetical protein
MPRFGADESFASTTSGGVFDSSGNAVVSADNEFGGSPLGPAALAQTLFSVANGTFNLLPPTIEEPISNENLLPYWSAPIDDSDGRMTAQVVFDTTSNTYSLRMNPGTALSGYTLSITTRSAVISDDNLSLRQKAIATLAKVGTYAGATQVNLSLTATYFDHTGTQLSTQAIGTVFDNGTVSSITGFTTAGTAVVGVSAAYVDLTFTMTATANVTSGIAFDIDTILLQTSQGGGGGAQSFLITETFTTSGTWTRPTGVDYLTALILVGGGGGGQSARAIASNGPTTNGAEGGAGGGGGGYLYVRDVYVGGAGSYTITVGAGGSGGGTAGTVRGSAAQTISSITIGGNAGSDGGTTFFGTSYYAAPGRGGGVTSSNPGAGGTFDASQWGAQILSTTGGAGGQPTTAGTTGTPTFGGAGGSAAFLTGLYSVMPYQSGIAYPSVGGTGGVSSVTKVAGSVAAYAVGSAGVAAGPAGYFCNGGAGGGGGRLNTAAAPDTAHAASGGSAASGGGAGGGGAMGDNFGTGTVILVAGAGGNAAALSASGGGGGGGVQTTSASTTSHRNTTFDMSAGAGGNGSQGYAILVYIA